MIFTAVVVMSVAQLSAGGPFGRRLRSRSVQPSRPKFTVPYSVLQSPEKMTELFGPSILVRDDAEPEAKPAKKSRFVKQPE